jgi:hypothetical protein
LIVKLRGSAFFNTRQPKVFQMTRLLWHLADFFNSINCTMKHNYGKKKGCGAVHFNSCYNCITWPLILLSYSLIYFLSITAHFILNQKFWDCNWFLAYISLTLWPWISATATCLTFFSAMWAVSLTECATQLCSSNGENLTSPVMFLLVSHSSRWTSLILVAYVRWRSLVVLPFFEAIAILLTPLLSLRKGPIWTLFPQ